MASTKSGIIDLLVGAAAVAASIFVPGIGTAVAAALMSAGSGFTLSRRHARHGRAQQGVLDRETRSRRGGRSMGGRAWGKVVQFNEWGDNSKMWDMVIILAAHKCQGGPTPNSLPVLQFNQPANPDRYVEVSVGGDRRDQIHVAGAENPHRRYSTGEGGDHGVAVDGRVASGLVDELDDRGGGDVGDGQWSGSGGGGGDSGGVYLTVDAVGVADPGTDLTVFLYR